MEVGIKDAKAHLSELIERAQSGDVVYITNMAHLLPSWFQRLGSRATPGCEVTARSKM